MIYIFEDHPNADISILFKSGYSTEIADKFIYSKGNGNLVNKAEDKLVNTTEQIVVFMDVIPGSKDCRTIYQRLCKLSKDNSNRVIVLPIICAEYYMIKSIKNDNLFEDTQERDNCAQKQPHLLSQFMKDADKKRFCKNFEKYCKCILKYHVRKSCIKPYNTETNVNGEYYRVDCICSDADDMCRQETLLQKAIDLLAEYPCIPKGSKAQNLKALSDKDAWDMHRKLVDEHNAFSDKYKAIDTNACNKYKHIKCI